MTDRRKRIPTRGRLMGLPPGPEGVRVTLRVMADLASQAKADPLLREQALAIVAAVPAKDRVGEARAVFEWVQRRIRYVGDVRGVETVQIPRKTLEYEQGDCDDMATLLAALLESIGHEVRFVAMGTTPGRFSHVFSEVLLDGDWVAMDPTEPVAFGWRPPVIASTMIQEIDGEVSKSQGVRLVDVFLLGPFMVYAATLLPRDQQLARVILAGSGVATVLYNGRNYLATREAA